MKIHENPQRKDWRRISVCFPEQLLKLYKLVVCYTTHDCPQILQKFKRLENTNKTSLIVTKYEALFGDISRPKNAPLFVPKCSVVP